MGNQTTNLQHRQLENVSARDALIGEGGGDVTRLMAPPQPMANGPAAAQEGGVPMPSADGNNGGGLVPPSLGRN